MYFSKIRTSIWVKAYRPITTLPDDVKSERQFNSMGGLTALRPPRRVNEASHRTENTYQSITSWKTLGRRAVKLPLLAHCILSHLQFPAFCVHFLTGLHACHFLPLELIRLRPTTMHNWNTHLSLEITNWPCTWCLTRLKLEQSFSITVRVIAYEWKTPEIDYT